MDGKSNILKYFNKRALMVNRFIACNKTTISNALYDGVVFVGIFFNIEKIL